MLKKLMKKKSEKKGFTLMELLIVVAIIAVLIAIAIPVFGGQLDKAKEATDKANVRAWYAEQKVEFMTNDNYTKPTYPTTGQYKLQDATKATVTVEGDTIDTFTVTYTPTFGDNTAVTFGK